jgi:thiol:disulfide interchange protein DsbD
MTVGAAAAAGDGSLDLLVTYQSCDDKSCLAPVIDQPLPVKLAVGSAGQPADPALFANFDPAVWPKVPVDDPAAAACPPVAIEAFGWRFDVSPCGSAGFILLLLVAMLGGMLLNFTPCVLPVIPIKIMSLSQVAGSWRRSFALGLAMSVGVVAFWLLLGLAIATVSGFTAANQLFQIPLFTLGVGVFIALMAVGMTGMFSLTLPQSVYRFNPGKETVVGSFFFGVLTAVLSTPCTAPFMGAAAAWAATQEAAVTLITFAAIGFGMALPYIVLSAVPRLVRKMPRTGPASQLIKEVMGLLMLAAAAYFIGVGLSGLAVQPPDPPSRAYWWVVAAFIAAAGAWLAWKTVQISHKPVTRGVFVSLGVLMVLGSAMMATSFTDHGPIAWSYYSPERFETAKAEGKSVLMEFTAEWCLNCKTLEETVLKDPRVVKLLRSCNVVPMKVDLTGNNTPGNALLKAVNRVTIPLLVVFDPTGSEVYKSDYYTVEALMDAVAPACGTVALAPDD